MIKDGGKSKRRADVEEETDNGERKFALDDSGMFGTYIGWEKKDKDPQSILFKGREEDHTKGKRSKVWQHVRQLGKR